MVFKFLKTF